MGRLSGFSYRSIIKRLRQFGFAFDRQGEQLSAKIDAVANDLAEHRRDTEAHI